MSKDHNQQSWHAEEKTAHHVWMARAAEPVTEAEQLLERLTQRFQNIENM